MLRRLLLAAAVLSAPLLSASEPQQSPENQVFQWMQHGTFEYAPDDVVNSVAYLWIPEACERVRGLLILGENVTEHGLVGHAAIREACAATDLGIVWCSPRFMSFKTLDDAAKHVSFLQQLLDGLARMSGYDEVATAPWLPIGESMHLRMVYHLLNAAPQRCIAGVCVKNAVSLTLCRNRETPLLVAVGTAQEWSQHEADIRTKWQDVSFYDRLLRERRAHPDWPLSLLVEGGSGHFDCTEAMARYFAASIAAYARMRLPDDPAEPLRPVALAEGFVAGLPLPDRDAFAPVPQRQAESERRTMAWYPDEPLAAEACRMAAINWLAESQLPAFVDAAGAPVPMAYRGITKLVPSITAADGITFDLEGTLLPEIPAGFVGAGEPLARAPGAPLAEWIAGSVAPTDHGRFRIALDRTWPVGPVCVALRHRGTESIRDVVQPAYLQLTANAAGAPQAIEFEPIADRVAGSGSVPLVARASSGMPVRFFVVAGPATVEGDALRLTPLPPRARLPLEITVTAWQWGRSSEPRVQTARPVTRTFRLVAAGQPEGAGPEDAATAKAAGSTTGPTAGNSDGKATESLRLRALPGWKDRLRLDLQRPIDARLALLEKGDVAHSGLFPGTVHRVATAAEVSRLSSKLAPGDQLVLASGTWRDASFTFAGQGTAAAPILVRPEAAGSVVFTGESKVRFHGEHLVVHDLAFRDVTTTQNNAVIFGVGNGEAKPADHCLFHRLHFENCGSTDPADRPKLKLWLMSMRGSGNTVAQCTFRGLLNLGQMLGAAELPTEGLQQLHVLDNHFRDRPRVSDENGQEVLQIGWSAERAAPTGSLIQGNTFERCDGENEMITLKASDIVFRDNRVLACQGVLCLRTARRVLVHDNLFDGQGRENTGGVRMQGDDHVVVGNTFRNLPTPKDYYFWPVSLMSANVETYGETDNLSGYGRARNILIARNRFERCAQRIAVGIYLRPQYPLLPQGIYAVDNVFTGGRTGSAFDFVADDPTGGLGRELHEARTTFRP